MKCYTVGGHSDDLTQCKGNMYVSKCIEVHDYAGPIIQVDILIILAYYRH